MRLRAGRQLPVDQLSADLTGSFRISSTNFAIGKFGKLDAAYAARCNRRVWIRGK
jgi:hypothetical protein